MRHTPRRSASRLAVFAACLPLLFASCSKTEEPTATPPSSESSTSTSQAAAVNSGATIDITEFAFNPSLTNVKVGQTVTWQNSGEATHQVAQVPDPGATRTFDSDLIAPGKNFVFTFTAEGPYKYICVIHTQMTGTLVVEK